MTTVRASGGELQAPLSQILLAAARALERLLKGQRLSDGIAHAAQTFALRGSSRAALQDIVFETTRRLGWVRMLAQRLNNKPPDEALFALQCVALVQLELALAATTGDAPLRHPAVIVDQAVAAARTGDAHPSRGAFLNATLRRFQREREALNGELATQTQASTNLPAWWLARLTQDHPKDWQRIVAAQGQAAPLTLRVNRRSQNRDALLGQLRARGLSAAPIGRDGIALAKSVDVTGLPGFAEGQFSVQDAGAQLAAHLLDVRPGFRVLDACAAPGGKTAHLLECGDSIELLALDSDPVRLQRVADNLERLGLSGRSSAPATDGLHPNAIKPQAIRLQAADAGEPASWWDGQAFDRILLDAPCTASGIVRRHPDVPWLRKRGDITTLAAQQQRLLKALWPLLKRGGKLLYVTCSIFPAEGKQVVRQFVDDHPDAALLNIDWNWTTGTSATTSTGKPGAPVNRYPGLMLLPTSPPVFATADSELLRDHDGFFYALLHKSG